MDRPYIQKTKQGIELRPAIIDPTTSNNLTYYYVWYSQIYKGEYVIETNESIFGDK
jgi:hypothetical protein